MITPPLSREQVCRAIERRNPSRVPLLINFWLHEQTFGARAGEVRSIVSRYPYDVALLVPAFPGYDASPLAGHPDYVWIRGAHAAQGVAHDANIILPDWRNLDRVLAEFPDPAIPEIMDGPGRQAAEAGPDLYRLGHFWYTFYERLWSFRGMQNALMDLYESPDEVHRLFRALTEFYLIIIRRLSKLGSDGILVTDDIGTQTGLMFSPAMFRSFFKPYFKALIDESHRLGMHFWLHTCGNVTSVLDDLVEIGLDVLHPIQKYAMDERKVAEGWGDRLCILGGMDVQHTLPHLSAEDVRREVRFMIDVYDRADGGFMITTGNEVTADIPPENLEAFFDEALIYGTEHRAQFRREPGSA